MFTNHQPSSQPSQTSLQTNRMPHHHFLHMSTNSHHDPPISWSANIYQYPAAPTKYLSMSNSRFDIHPALKKEKQNSSATNVNADTSSFGPLSEIQNATKTMNITLAFSKAGMFAGCGWFNPTLLNCPVDRPETTQNEPLVWPFTSPAQTLYTEITIE